MHAHIHMLEYYLRIKIMKHLHLGQMVSNIPLSVYIYICVCVIYIYIYGKYAYILNEILLTIYIYFFFYILLTNDRHFG